MSKIIAFQQLSRAILARYYSISKLFANTERPVRNVPTEKEREREKL